MTSVQSLKVAGHKGLIILTLPVVSGIRPREVLDCNLDRHEGGVRWVSDEAVVSDWSVSGSSIKLGRGGGSLKIH